MLFSDMLMRYARSKSGPMESDVDFIRPCGVIVFALFYCCLDLLW